MEEAKQILQREMSRTMRLVVVEREELFDDLVHSKHCVVHIALYEIKCIGERNRTSALSTLEE